MKASASRLMVTNAIGAPSKASGTLDSATRSRQVEDALAAIEQRSTETVDAVEDIARAADEKAALGIGGGGPRRKAVRDQNVLFRGVKRFFHFFHRRAHAGPRAAQRFIA